jgi:thiosulfate/3-mercaptopyruvate sulfurtransferase
MMNKRSGMAVTVGMLLGLLAILACGRPGMRAGEPWGPDQLVQPDQLAKRLASPEARKPLLLHVGVRDLYRRGHIVDSKYVGMAADPDGIRKLKEEVQNRPLDTEIIIYCGCCPWDVCPNMRPAFQALTEMGFKNVKLLYIPRYLQEDWVERGFPTQKGN